MSSNLRQHALDRWAPALFAYSRSEGRWDEAALVAALRAFMPSTQSGRPPSDDDIRRKLARFQGVWSAMSLQNGDLTMRTRRDGGLLRLRRIGSVQLLVRGPLEVLGDDGRPLNRKIEPHLSNDARWMLTRVHRGELQPARVHETSWFLDQFRRAVDHLRADFAFATSGPVLVEMGSIEPRAYAWPVMVFGAEACARIGKRHLMESPASYVVELPHGAWWVEVAESPFLVTQNELDAFAEHVGLKSSLAPISVERFEPDDDPPSCGR